MVGAGDCPGDHGNAGGVSDTFNVIVALPQRASGDTPDLKDRIAMVHRLRIKQRAKHRGPLTFEFAVLL